MSKFVVNTDLFGYYAKIPTGFDRENHTYKVVSVFRSNGYCDVPLLTCKTKETLHEEITDVLNVIHCGIDESKTIRVALKDCELIKPDVAEVKHGYWRTPSLTPYCSVCLNPSDYDCDGTHTQSAYCPSCGAKMDGGKE